MQKAFISTHIWTSLRQESLVTTTIMTTNKQRTKKKQNLEGGKVIYFQLLHNFLIFILQQLLPQSKEKEAKRERETRRERWAWGDVDDGKEFEEE